jgi:hypothetical protein
MASSGTASLFISPHNMKKVNDCGKINDKQGRGVC